MENAEILFEQILKHKKKELDRMLVELESEHGLFDFKCKSDNDGKTPLNKDDRENFSKALSGFANASGGLLIWGINKKNNKKGTYRLIKAPENFVENLNSAIAELAMPHVENVQNKLIYKTKGDGVIVTYIPESDKTPHMALADKRYYKRIGDSFRKMEHHDIEDMFGRRNKPKLELGLKATLSAESKPAATYLLRVSITNTGRAVSRSYGFDLEFVTKLLDGQVHNSYMAEKGLIVDNTEAGNTGIGLLKYRAPYPSAIFPEETVKISPNNYELGHIQFLITESQLDAYKDFELKCTVYSENMRSQKETIKFKDLFK